MAGSAGALQQAGDALRGADLDDLIDGRKINSEIERGCADDAFERAVAEPVFSNVPLGTIEGAVVHCYLVLPVWPAGEEFLKPDFGLRAGVGE